MDLKGKRIIVTGGATGIGRATALRVGAYGAMVAVFDVNDAAGSATVADINEAGGNGRYWHVDVAHEAAVSGGVIAAESWLGGIDVLLHFAGVLEGVQVDIDQFPEDTWDMVVDTNLKGSYLIAKHVVSFMRKQRHGTIVLAASGAGVKGGSSSYAYGSSKGGVHGLAMVMAQRLAEYGIRVNDIAPGSVDTPLKVAATEEALKVTGDRSTYENTMNALVTPDGISRICAFLASDDAEYVTGTIFTR